MDAIRERAVGLLRAAGGALPGAALARGLFGGCGPAWDAILEQALNDPRFARLPPPDDGWRLVEERADDGGVVLAIETTGQDPRRAALVQIAACRVVAGRPGPLFHTLVNPERRLPGWLADRLGVDPGMGDNAPPLADALAQLAEFVGDAPIVAFDAGWTLRFVNEQCRKAGRPAFPNSARDLLPAASALTGSAKPALATVAAKLGIPVVHRHRGAADALLIAQIAARLDATDALPTSDRLVGMLGEMPDSPGVYIFRGAGGEPLYVGKAKRLRRRVRSYLTRPADCERDLAGLRALTVSLDWKTTPDDLAAAMLESELIAAHQPRFNTQRRALPVPAHLELSLSEPFPRLRRVRGPGPGRFGPFLSGARAVREARLVTSVFLLRTCARKLGVPRKSNPRPPCSLLERGRCLGPCTGAVPVEEYAELVAKARAFLAGDRQGALREVQGRVRAAAARGDRAEAARLCGLLRTLATRWSDDPPSPPDDPANIAILLPAGAPERAYLIIAGLLRWSGPIDDLTSDALAAAPIGEAAKRGGVIAQRWLTTNRGAARVVPLPPEAPPDEVVRRVTTALAS